MNTCRCSVRPGWEASPLLQENPAFRKVSIPLVPQSLRDVRWDGGTAYSTGRGDASYVVFSLPIVEYAYGIRLRYSYWNEDLAPPVLSLYWRGDGHEEFTADRSGHYSATGDRANWERGTWGRSKDPESTLTIWTLRCRQGHSHPSRCQARCPQVVRARRTDASAVVLSPVSVLRRLSRAVDAIFVALASLGGRVRGSRAVVGQTEALRCSDCPGVWTAPAARRSESGGGPVDSAGDDEKIGPRGSRYGGG